jgi:DNA transposition AAA+ family ATPase
MAAKEALSETLKRLIENSGQSRYQIWRATGIDQATLSRFMNGKGGLSVEALDAIAEFLDLEIVKRQSTKPRQTKKGK